MAEKNGEGKENAGGSSLLLGQTTRKVAILKMPVNINHPFKDMSS